MAFHGVNDSDVSFIHPAEVLNQLDSQAVITIRGSLGLKISITVS